MFDRVAVLEGAARAASVIELADYLRTMRADLVTRMAADLAAGCDVHSWLATLAQVQTAITAVEAVMEEGSRG